jgi:hypothetical protein
MAPYRVLPAPAPVYLTIPDLAAAEQAGPAAKRTVLMRALRREIATLEHDLAALGLAETVAPRGTKAVASAASGARAARAGHQLTNS